ncbi:MAG: translation initiation factor IF-2 [Desulfobacterium sp.]|nr:translation initiation factor IF-2 [Desulfobacterium sp.]
MAKIRFYELARDLNMTNKILLSKIKDLDVDIKSHMSSLDARDVSLIKSHVLGTKELNKIEESRVKPTVIRRRKKVESDSSEVIDPMMISDEEPDTDATEVDAAKREPEDKLIDDIEETAIIESSVEMEEVSLLSSTENELFEDDAPSEENVLSEKSVLSQKIEAEETVVVEEQVSEVATFKEESETSVETEKEKIIEDVILKSKKPIKKTKKQAAAKIIKLPTQFPEEMDEKIIIPEIKVEKEKTVEKEKFPVKAIDPIIDSQILSAKEAKKSKKKQKLPDLEQDAKFFKKKISFRRKEIVEGNALYGGVRARGKKGKKGAKAKQTIGEKTLITTPKAIKRRVKIDDTIILSDLAKRMGIKANEMIQKLMMLGVMATVNQTIDFDTAELVAAEFEYEVERASFEEDTFLRVDKDEDPDKQIYRPPVVTIMGHVDHGKTSLLDVIRKSSVTDNEAGGITQHIGAYNVQTDKGRIVFLDTPGHEAFTAMRSRGAMVTDLVVLVVAADDGVMPQTIEAINHSKAAEVPIIVAVNKIDKPEADIERVKRELSEHGIVSEEWGGDSIFVYVSAKQKTGIDDLLDMILLQAEVLELKANPDKLAKGHVIEAKLDSGRGPVATVLILEGTLHAGDPVVCGIHYGKVRAMLNDSGEPIDQAGPSIPVEILGLNGVPEAGDELISIDDEKNAKQVSSHRAQKQRSKELAKSSRLSLEGLFEKLKEGILKELNLIIKADVHGSIEALKDSLTKLSGDEVKINVVHAATGTITESDVSLAAVSNAIILGFNVRPGGKVQEYAADENVDIRFYDIIYNAIKDIKDAMVGMMDSTYVEKILGRAEVREIFVIPKKGTIAGSHVLNGKMERGQRARLLRDGIVIYDGKVISLRRFKDDVKEVQAGYECGIGIENFNDIKLKDEIECYYLEEIKPTMA